MKKIGYLLAALTIFCLPLLAFSGCGNNGSSNKIVLSEVTHSIFYAPLYIAINKGYFEDEGLELELINGNGSDKVMTAIVSGSATIGLAGPETAVYTALQSGDNKSPKVFGQLTACDGSFLVGRNAQPNFTLENLRGKKIIAGRRGGMPAMTLEYALYKAGLVAGKDYTLDLSIDFGLVASAFEGGQGDYCTMFEPVASDYVASGNGSIVASVGELGGAVPYTAFIASQDYLEHNKVQAEQFLRAVYRGYHYMTTANIDDVVKALKPSFSSSADASIKRAIENYISIDAIASSPVMTESSFTNLCNIIKFAGVIDKNANVPFDKVIDNTIANSVISYFA